MTRTALTIAALVSLALAACGGGDDGGAETPTTAAPATTQSQSQDSTTTAAPATEAPEAPSPNAAAGTGTATLGSDTWDFELGDDPRAMCNPDFSGFFIVTLFGQNDGGQEVTLSINAPGSGGAAVVQTGATAIDGELWIANAEVYDDYPAQTLEPNIGATAVVDGNSISGTGLFYEDRSLSETRQTGSAYETGVREGTFSVTCP